MWLVAFLLVCSQANAQITWYQDADGDGWGNPSVSQSATSKPTGYVQNSLDCNDSHVDGLSWFYEGPTYISSGKGANTNIAIARNGTIYVAYVDKNAGSKVTVMKKSGSSWVLVGSAGFTPTAASELSLAIDNNNTLYIAYNNSNRQNVTVMQYNGSSWVNVGAAVTSSYGYSPDLAIDTGNTPYIVYGYSDPVVKKYNGSSWVAVGTPANTGNFNRITRIAIDGTGTPYIIYDEDYPNAALYAKKYNGSNWVAVGSAIALPNYYVRYADIVIDGNDTPYVIHSDVGSSFFNPSYVKKYNGSSWVLLGSNFGVSDYGALAIDGSGTPYVFYSDASYNGNGTVKKYNGSGWPIVGAGIITSTSYAEYTAIAIDSTGIPHVAFVDDQLGLDSVSVMSIEPLTIATTPTLAGTTNIYCGNSTTLSVSGGNLNAAAKWKWYTGSCGGTPVDSGTSVTVSPAATTTYYVRGEGGCAAAPGACGSITVTVSKYHWYADADGDGFGNSSVDSMSCAAPTGYVGNSLDCNDGQANPASWTDVGSSFSTGTAYYLHSAIDGNGTPYAVFQDGANNNKATVKKYNGSNWVTVGNAAFTPGEVRGTTIAIDAGGTPYIAYRDFANGEKASVMKFNGTSWVQVGNAGFTSAKAYENTIAIDRNNVPYIIYTDGNTGKANVMKYNGSSWVFVGGSGISAGDAYYFDIAFDGANTPYVAYKDVANNYKTSVMKYNGSNWVFVGNPGFSTGQTNGTSLVIDDNGTPYVAFPDNQNNYKGTVMKYNGTSWVSLGTAGDIIAMPSLAIYNNTLYFAYRDGGQNDKAAVSKYDGTSWSSIGTAVSPKGHANEVSMVIDGPGKVYVLYTDSSTFIARASTMIPAALGNANTPQLAAAKDSIYCGNNTILSIDTGKLNDAAQWKWYTGSCGGTLIDSGNHITVSPSVTTTYYARGEGGCSNAPGSCGSVTVTVTNRTWYADADNDGWGNPAVDSMSCAQPAGYVANNYDCNDNAVNPRGWKHLGNPGFSAGAAQYLTTAKDAAGTLYIAYSDQAYSSKATVMKYDGSNWVTVGNAGFSAGSVSGIQIAVDAGGVPYVGYTDGGNSGKGTVMKYNGVSWVNVGNAGFTPGGAYYTAMNVDGNGTPYLLFADNANGQKASVMKYNGNNWVYVGTPAFSIGKVWFTTMEFDASNIPYVGFRDDGTGGKASVMKFDGSNWALVGSSGFTLGAIYSSAMKLDASGTPYFAYREDGNGSKGTVMKYNGSNWAVVGTAGFTGGFTNMIDLAIDGTTLYYSYTDTAQKATMMKYDGSSWVYLGRASASYINYTSIQILDHIPYLMYSDYTYGWKVTASIPGPVSLGTPSTPVLATSDTILCGGTTATLSIQSGNLNDASQWHWYSSSCGGTPVGTGSTIQVTPLSTTTYYARGEGSCLSSPGVCDSIVIKSFADPVVTTDPADSAICNNGSATFKIIATAGNSLAYQWQVNTGAGYTDITNGGIYSGATATTGTLQLTGVTTAMDGYKYRCIVTNGCARKDTSGEAILTVHPVPAVNAVTDKVVCNSAATAISFSGPVSGTTYSWANNTTSIGLAASGNGNIASFAAANTTNAPVIATVIVTPSANGCTGTKDTFTIQVNPTPNVIATNDQALCNGAATAAVNFSGAVPGTSYSWTNNTTSTGLTASGTGNIASFAAANNTNAPVTVTIIVTPSANSCTGAKDTFAIKVNPTPNVVSISDQAVCNGAPAAAVNFNGTVSGTAYSWVNNTTSTGLAANGNGNIASFTATNTTNAPVTSTIIVTPSANSCTGPNDTFTITVNPIPNVVATTDQVLCNGAPVTAINFSGSVSNTSYNWINSDASIGLATNSTGNIASFTATNNINTLVMATVIVTPSANGCTGTKDTFAIKVNPTPNVVAISDQAVCNGAPTAAVNFNGTVSGTAYSWANNTTSIGLAASGNGNIAPSVTTNNTNAPVTATVTVTPSANGCTGTKDTFAITVNPTPNVAATGDQILCNGTATTAVNFSGTVSGTAYSWINNAASIGLSASGNGNIASFATTNSTSAPVTAMVMVTPLANGCTGTKDTFTITVNPTPDVANISNQALCNSAATTAINFSGSVTGSTYNWTNNTTSIGLAANGTGNIPSFNAANSSNTLVTATITVTPSANGCLGTAKMFNINVNPTPTVAAVSSQSLCHGIMVNPITFSGTVSGTVYNWTNSATSIGLAASGMGDIAAFAVSNTGPAPVVATITVTPVANNCAGQAGNFSITANPIPNVAAVPDQTVCNNAPTTTVNYSGNVTGTLYSWTNNNTSIGLAANGTGDITSFTAGNTATAPVAATITVTPSANGCTGNAETFGIKVNPTPKLSSTLTPSAICAHTTFEYTPQSLTTGTFFTWTRAALAGITPATASGTGGIYETLSSSLLTQTDVKYLYTLTANGCANTETVTLPVQPVPVIPTIETKSLGSVCNNTLFQNFSAEHPQPAGVEYTWTANNAEIWSTGGNKQFSLINFIHAGKVVIKLTANVTGFTCTSSDSFEVEVSNNNTAVIPTVVYYNQHFVCLDNSMEGYQWGYDDAATLDSVVLYGEKNQDYLNEKPDFTHKYYWVITKDGDCSQKTYYNAPTGVRGPVQPSTAFVKVYPNPATDYADIEIGGIGANNLRVELLDMTGKSIRTTEPVNSKTRVYVGDIAAGMYSVICYQNGVRIAVGKLVKN